MLAGVLLGVVEPTLGVDATDNLGADRGRWSVDEVQYLALNVDDANLLRW